MPWPLLVRRGRTTLNDMAEMYEVDPDGDLIVILPLPLAPVPFAPWRGWDEELPTHTNAGEAINGEELADNEVAPFTKRRSLVPS